MKKLIVTLILYLFVLKGYSQNKFINGFIFDYDSIPQHGAIICQKGSDNCYSSGFYGDFHLLVDSTLENTLEIECFFHKNLIIENIDTIKYPLIIRMELDTTTHQDLVIETIDKPKPKISFYTSLKCDYFDSQFNDYSNSIEAFNTDLMNIADATIEIELAVIRNKWNYSASIGFHNYSDNDHDSLDINLFKTRYAIELSYDIINSKRIIFSPLISFKWNRYRLLNNDNKKKIPIETYNNNRDLDIRFNQTYALFGLKTAYKIYEYNY
jgi:hypothetical protein